MTPSRRTAVRLALFYAAFFAMIGVHVPFWPAWLASKGMDPTRIGILLAVAVSVKVAVSPLLAQAADRAGERRRLMVLLAAGALAGFSLFGFVDGFWPILAVTVLFSVLWTAILPLGESLTLIAAQQGDVPGSVEKLK